MVGTDVAKLINNGTIKNLADINWEKATDWWEEDMAKEIIDAINDRELKPFIIDAMLSEWEYKKRKTIKGGYNMTFYNSLQRLKKYIGDYSLFNIDTIKKQNQELTQIKQDIRKIKEKVFALPDELNTDKAKGWLQVAIDNGLLDINYQTTDKTATKPQKALLAEILSEKIGLKCKYKPFETLWGVNGLSQSRYKSKEEKGTVRGGEIIMEAFK